MAGLVDLHSHILPGLDDGPAQLEDAVELVTALESLGFSEFYPTPHQKAGSWAPQPAERDDAATALREALRAAGSGVTIHPPAGENMWDDLFLRRQDDGGFPTYPGGRAFLLEFPPEALPPQLPERLFQFRVGGLLPVIAHVERYPALAGDATRLERVGRSAGLLVNVSTLGGIAGWWTRRATRRLVRKGLVHAAATDSHGPDDVAYTRAGLQWLRSALGTDATEILLSDNPRRMLAGELPD